MAASFPGGVRSFGADRVDGEYIPASDMNGVREEVVALETWALAGLNGWQAASWAGLTRTGATTFTTTTNVTNVIQKGDKLRFTDTTTKYLNVLSLSAYSGGIMTITTIANTNYALVGNPSAMYYSKIENPQGWPDWFSYTSTISGASGSAGTYAETAYASRFKITGKTCHVVISKTVTNVGSWGGQFLVLRPVACANEDGVKENGEILSSTGLATKANIVSVATRNYFYWRKAWITSDFVWTDVIVGDYILVDSHYVF